MVEFVWGDPDAEKIHEGLVRLIEVQHEVISAQRATHRVALVIHEEVTRQIPPSPVPKLLADIIARLERIEQMIGRV